MSAGPRCVGAPISWLRLEQHHAGDLGVSESAAIAAHRATCGACASCLARIVRDDALPLPALPVAPPAKVRRVPSRSVAFRRVPSRSVAFRRVAPVLAALAVAAVISSGSCATTRAWHEPMTVCVVWNDGALVDRGAMRGLTPESLPLASCKLLDPAPVRSIIG